MKKHISLLVLFIISMSVSVNAHSHHQHQNTHNRFDREWNIDKKHIHGALYMMKHGTVVIETKKGLFKVPYILLSKSDQSYVDNRYAAIRMINTQKHIPQNTPIIHNTFNTDYRILIALFSLGVIGIGGVYLTRKKPQLALPLGILAFSCLAFGFNNGYEALHSVSTNPLTIDSAFTPFKKNVTTSWNATYFRVGSIGLATTHEMMKGITAWQQQVPIPQCYLENNAWSIPLNPMMAVNSLPVDQKHFTRGAIALAINGIPIFNPYTNTGVDAFLDGQLDDFGGHSGRADDYHYHIAPTHLYGFTASTMPIAYAFDGFAIYGDKEPDGYAMRTLDTHHGHADANGVYHYHGTNTAPYMIASFAGEVTEDSTYQLIPQSAAKGCRPALTPLKGATITGHKANGNNGYTLTYTLNGQTNSVQYSWTPQGNYTYIFTTPTGSTTNNYKGNAICSIPVTNIQEETTHSDVRIVHNQQALSIIPQSDLIALSQIHIQLYSVNGSLLAQQSANNALSLQSLPFGRYYVRIQPGNFIHSIVHIP